MYTSIKTFGLTAVLAVSAAALVAGHEQQDRSAAGKRHQNMRRGGLSEAEGMHNLEKRDYTYVLPRLIVSLSADGRICILKVVLRHTMQV